MVKLLEFLDFEEKCAEERRTDKNHEDHTEQWNERYWHGYAAAIRRTKQWVNSVLFMASSEELREVHDKAEKWDKWSQGEYRMTTRKRLRELLEIEKELKKTLDALGIEMGFTVSGEKS